MKADCVYCFRTLSTKARFNIFEHLKKSGEKTTVSSLVKLTVLRQPTVTFHLKELAKRRLVRRYKAGRNVYYQTHKNCRNCPLFAY
ncbi:MAG: hypothetical protein A2126_01235 [Candidatus Woykebacteria bacterium GWB1_45_5]|uniref:HTH arsR-type domain-containing protein n=2 Tax=Candidatus Woykeibacteriota TaxID=1817899 RepID=A0A1G1W511_9BACT|nr:MAG: hypothetical protein A2113_02200 [Candidatus Woykebacteria bacterium GWA1_44_8]OGY22799.1 MAG: hypothetical protein A2126_01235 [Candidatus Woykebacteria bacterium GWB1_45_5]